MTKNLYELQAPTSWAAPPERFSFSSLQAIEACPRKWQLLNSTWGEFGRFPQRSHPKAIEGSIIHEAIEQLIKALGQQGMPSIGSPRFQKALDACGFWDYFGAEIQRQNEKLAKHPRRGPFFTVRTPPRELANQAIRLLRSQYKPLDGEPLPLAQETSPPNAKPKNLKKLLDKLGALPEAEVSHPSLPFDGIIDLVEAKEGQTRIVDFKTGKKKEQHLQQLEYYGVLWWRHSGEAPQQVAVQYLNEELERNVSVEHLEAAEKGLKRRIALAKTLLSETPAEARPGEGCRFCPVRARCEEGWAAYQASLATVLAGTGDVEIVVSTKPSPTGFLGKVGKKEKSVVYPSALKDQLPEIEVGTRLRLVDAVFSEEGKTVEIRPWTEVFLVT